MTRFIYLGLLLASTAAVLLVDRRFRLFFWRAPVAAALVTTIGVAFFLSWDVAGIAAGVFFAGESRFDTDIHLGPEMPLEEPFFLSFLALLTMNLYTGACRLSARRSSPAEAVAP